jgi:hypothetical protein
METLPVNFFNKFPKLETLEVVHCLNMLEKNNFLNNKQLKVLLLIQTNLKVLRNGTFFHCKKLTSLEIRYSSLEMIEIDAFVGAENLEVLIIVNSLMSHIGRVFVPLRSLKRIQISYSNVVYLEDELFLTNRNLKEVNFQRNHLSNLTENVFKGARLQYLSLSLNHFIKIVRFPTSMLSVVENKLTEIWIMEDYLEVMATNNQITDIICAEFSRIRELNLQFNLISDLQCIKDLERLRILVLSFNKLTNLTSETFSKLIYLHALYLSGNKLFNFDIQWFASMKFLTILQVDGFLNHTNVSTILPKL